ncbi:MAG: hypothetical protein R2724_17015 [Bryobacterales bacterium]
MAASGSKDAPEQEIAKLREDIRRHEHLYYVLDQPEISDAEFDERMQRLQKLEEAHPDLVTPDSPTNASAERRRAGFSKEAHSSAMLSLDNAFGEDELRDFDRRARGLIDADTIAYVGELKLDGLSLAVRFQDGSMVLALTRGDGETERSSRRMPRPSVPCPSSSTRKLTQVRLAVDL